MANIANKSFIAVAGFAWLSFINPTGSRLFPHAHRGLVPFARQRRFVWFS
jgi:hypothetical protein